ncbi:ribosome hibernation factor-recruiting GTPase MRF [Gordonia soli]|uniref:CobW C-terminal domain-containing protein n=1 Tax=Gordonia soli NBRC 108243 TaxID=1223545 RepID=M0QJM8_9ACTN|nr:GTP-binding protein [Gordonia soli]GAC68659.1 hypothetical protein GS4_17_00450 [Gordonia soli NBRC 108243]
MGDRPLTDAADDVGEIARTPVVLVTGLDQDAVERTATATVVAGTTLVHHDLRDVASGRVIRTLRSVDLEGEETVSVTEVDLVHGCVSCTIREDLLPTLRRLHRRSTVETIVVQLDPMIEPEALSWAIDEVVVAEMPGFVDGPAGLDVRVHATIACVAEDQWLEAATGDLSVGEAGLGDPDDDRTLAQVAVGQVAFADALVVAGCDPMVRDSWESARLVAVLARLAPGAPVIMELPQRPVTALLVAQMLGGIGPEARRGRLDDPHGPLLRGQPPLDTDCGVSLVEFHSDRPFHPDRLHSAIDVLLDGVVAARGRLWLASQPDEALWLESAGGGLRVAHGGAWLAAMTEDERAGQSSERLAMAALRWGEHGDRHSALVVLAHRADASDIQETLRAACLTDAELAQGQALWLAYDDPFGQFHADPCDDVDRPDQIPADTTAADNRGERA